MDSIRNFAELGGPVLGLCNGFQVLTEAHLLPGALLRNESLRFHCRWVDVRVETTRTAWTHEVEVGEVLLAPRQQKSQETNRYQWSPRRTMKGASIAPSVGGVWCSSARGRAASLCRVVSSVDSLPVWGSTRRIMMPPQKLPNDRHGVPLVSTTAFGSIAL